MTKFKGLIQHSFALRLMPGHSPFDGHSTEAAVAERFDVVKDDGARFRVATLPGSAEIGEASPSAAHTLLGRTDLTTVRPKPLTALDETEAARPPVFSWAGPGKLHDKNGERNPDRAPRPRMIFAGHDRQYGRPSENDFLVSEAEPDAGGRKLDRVAGSFLEAVAYRRSQLFGLAIANRFVNVMLPCATLMPAAETGGDRRTPAGALLLLPLVSLMRDGGDHRAFRRMYSLTLYALPVKPGGEWDARKMRHGEIDSLVNAGWGLADAFPRESVVRYDVNGPLFDYVTQLMRPGAVTLLDRARAEGSLSFRMATEMVAYAVALRMVQGSRGEARETIRRRIGDDVVTTLSTARVSAALLVDPKLKPKEIKQPIWLQDPPGSLKILMKRLSGASRTPDPWTRVTRRKYRLDRPFVDSQDYAVGILPTSRCLVVAYVRKKRRKNPVPLLSLVAGVTFMTVGSATAIGMLRSIDRDLEGLEREDPRKIAEIDAEIATDLHEIYDLDIARETYRNLYQRLRDRFGIADDYKVLQDKMQTLYRATSTFHDDKEQKQLAWLTGAIVALSVLILIGTIVVAAKPG